MTLAWCFSNFSSAFQFSKPFSRKAFSLHGSVFKLSQNQRKRCNLAMEIAWTNRIYVIVFAFQRRFLGRHNCCRGDKIGSLTTVGVACHWSLRRGITSTFIAWLGSWLRDRGRSVKVLFDAYSFFVRHRYLRFENLNLSCTSKTLESLRKLKKNM